MPSYTDLSDPLVQIGVTVVLVVLLVGLVFACSLLTTRTLVPRQIDTYLRFAWNCFFKPQTARNSRNQQDALEGFYKAQASIYDASRMRLLRGREDLLGLVAAQVQNRVEAGQIPRKPVWVDVGGGTGYNIEQMGRFVDVPNFFSAVYLVDLSPSLCSVAEDRFARLGWKNVKVLCQDARSFTLHPDSTLEKGQGQRPDVITMSYSLSMIPDYYSVLDSLAARLNENGIFGVADFYVQSEVDYQSRNYIGGEINRHCMWISRVFWRTWFEADRVSLEAARRDYLEYRFGTILSFNDRCRLAGLRIPYYVWVGCAKDAGTSQAKLAELNAAATESPYLSALDLHNRSMLQEQARSTIEIRSKAYESAVVNLAASLPLPPSWYQAHHWRIFYDDSLQKHRQFKDEYIYAFTWEDSRVDARILNLNEDDVVLAITSAGDNILAYAQDRPKRIHAVDLNPTQNHLLELKVAAYTALPYSDFWALFGQGTHANFREILITKLSPHLSCLAFQYWLHHGPATFSPNSKGLYSTGGSRHALQLVSWLFGMLGLKSQVARLCEAQTLAEQREVWFRTLRRVLLSRLLSWCVVSNKQWLWKALGVPNAQREMIEHDYARMDSDRPLTPPSSPPGGPTSPLGSPLMTPLNEKTDPLAPGEQVRAREDVASYGSGRAIWNYAVQTLDPVINHTLLSETNHYYLLCLLGHYTRRCHPSYLTPRAHVKLSRPGAFDGLRIHTDEVAEVVERMQPSTLTVAVIMDSMDWFEPEDVRTPAQRAAGIRSGREEVQRQVRLLRRALRTGGRVLLRSAGTNPWYIDEFVECGFRPRRVNVRTQGACVDRVNMYASTWLLTKQADAGVDARHAALQPLSLGEAAQL